MEFFYKNDALGDPMVTEEHITAFGWATPQDLDDIVALTLRVNDFLFGLFLGCGIKLIDFKVEFGRLYEDDMVRIVLADEISPDSCRLWDLRTNEKSGQGPVPPRSRQGRGSLSGGGAAARHPDRPGTAATCAARPLCNSDAAIRGEMKARVHVTLKNGVLDPQGKAIGHSLNRLGFAEVGERPAGQVHRARAR